MLSADGGGHAVRLEAVAIRFRCHARAACRRRLAASAYALGLCAAARPLISVGLPWTPRPGPRSAPSRRGVRDPLRPVKQSHAVAGEQVEQMYASETKKCDGDGRWNRHGFRLDRGDRDTRRGRRNLHQRHRRRLAHGARTTPQCLTAAGPRRVGAPPSGASRNLSGVLRRLQPSCARRSWPPASERSRRPHRLRSCTPLR